LLQLENCQTKHWVNILTAVYNSHVIFREYNEVNFRQYRNMCMILSSINALCLY